MKCIKKRGKLISHRDELMALRGLLPHGERLEHGRQRPELGALQDPRLVGRVQHQRHRRPQQHLGSLREEAVPQSERGLHRQDVGEGADEPL